MVIPRGQIYNFEYEQTPEIVFSWDNFRGGLNTLLKENEIEDNELAEMENLMLVGKGAPTKRWGTSQYFLGSATGAVRGLGGFYQADGTNQLLCVTDQGILTRKSNASYSAISGVSWASGYDMHMAQLGDQMYFVNGQRNLVRYSNPTLVGFATIATPSGVVATQYSGVSGANTYSYRVSAVSSVGETLASTAVEADNCPQDLTSGAVKVSWSAVSAATGILQGYNVYGRTPGDESFLHSVDADSNMFFDDGTATPYQFTYPPTADSTAGVKAKYITRFQDRLVFAGIDGEPSMVVISGREPNQEKFDLSYGGNYIRIEPDAGDEVTGITTYRDRIIVFKERSIWRVTLGTQAIGNFFVTIPEAQLITKSHGCIASKSIVAVENDIFFLSDNGVFILGYEPNIAIDVLRTNELSVKIRPDMDNISRSNKTKAAATYYDSKYILSFPGLEKTYVFDRERQCWLGPWDQTTRTFEVYEDSNDEYCLLFGQTDGPNVREYDEDSAGDRGTAILTSLKTKKYDWGDWSIFKIIKEVMIRFRDLTGGTNISVSLEKRDGTSSSSQSFDAGTTSGTVGWGADVWANTLWGDTEEEGGATGEIIDEIKWVRYGSGKLTRSVQVLVDTAGLNSNYELLNIKGSARLPGKGRKLLDWMP